MSKFDSPFTPHSFEKLHDALVWLKALDRENMIFHFDDDPGQICWHEDVVLMTTDMLMHLCNRRREFLALLHLRMPGTCPFEFAHSHAGGGWTLPRSGNEDRAIDGQRGLDALRVLHEEHECDDCVIVADFLANLMHLKSRRWVKARLKMADYHWEAESEEA